MKSPGFLPLYKVNPDWVMKKMAGFEKGMIQMRRDEALAVERKVEKMRAFKSTGAFSSHALFHQRH